MAETTVGREKLMKKLRAAQKKNADARARENVKPRKGTFADRVKDTAKKAPEKRGLPAKIDKSRGNANKANPPKEIRLKGEGGTGRALKDTKFKPIPLGDKPKALPPPRPAARTFNPGAVAGRLFGPAGFLVGMTTPIGDGREDKPSGHLMRGGRQPGYKYRGSQTVDRSGKGDRKASTEQPKVSVNREKKTDAPAPPKPKARPVRSEKAAAFRAKMQGQRPAKKASPPRPTFRGNWRGATPTEMQKRGGARIKRKGFFS